jgi:hypothetical protein
MVEAAVEENRSAAEESNGSTAVPTSLERLQSVCFLVYLLRRTIT